MALNAQQRAVYDAIVYRGESVFFGGDAGTGKTHLAREIIAALGDGVCVCAYTGQAAQLVDGFTVHQLFGLTPPRSGVGAATRLKTWRLREDLAAATAVVIDECSMLSEQIFRDMDYQARFARRRPTQPFGGVQVVCLGDFLQLPPVGDRATADGRFCFAAPVFAQLFGSRMYRLTEQMRQGDDARFAAALSALRRGECPPEVHAMLRSRLVSPSMAPPARDVTHLFCLRRDAEACNSASLAQLSSSSFSTRWVALDWFASEECQRLASSLPMEPELELKTGAPVILTRNIDLSRRLVNGARGIVVGIHTLCELGVGPRCGDPEQCDVCAERSEPMHEPPPMIGEMPPRGWNRCLPVVKFGGDGDEGRRFIVGPVTVVKRRPAKRTAAAAAVTLAFKRKIEELEEAAATVPRGEVLARRTQEPLMLAFGFTIHKAQGMTLERVVLAWNKAFDPGQAYVGLSRCPRLENVHIVSSYVPVDRICASPEALAFEREKLREPPVSSSSSRTAAAAAADLSLVK
jgi:ATP-dependent DNA helicase PIF1